jgi:hypothetical protein
MEGAEVMRTPKGFCIGCWCGAVARRLSAETFASENAASNALEQGAWSRA